MNTKPYYCAGCKQRCNGRWADFGIGSYEFWGQGCHNVNWQFVSDCCENDLYEDAELVCPVEPPGEDDE